MHLDPANATGTPKPHQPGPVTALGSLSKDNRVLALKINLADVDLSGQIVDWKERCVSLSSVHS